jgi:hypothetical protein
MFHLVTTINGSGKGIDVLKPVRRQTTSSLLGVSVDEMGEELRLLLKYQRQDYGTKLR